MNLIQRLKLFFRNISQKNKSLPSVIEENEKATRYLFSDSQFTRTKETVNYSAFLPPKDNLEVSVMRTLSLSWAEVWTLGKEEVEAKRPDGRTIKARADFFCRIVSDQNLNVVPETSSHFRHANIVGWPEDKVEQKLKAMEISRKSFLHFP